MFLRTISELEEKTDGKCGCTTKRNQVMFQSHIRNGLTIQNRSKSKPEYGVIAFMKHPFCGLSNYGSALYIIKRKLYNVILYLGYMLKKLGGVKTNE